MYAMSNIFNYVFWYLYYHIDYFYLCSANNLVSDFIELSLNFDSGLGRGKKGFKTIYQKISNTLLQISVVENHMDAK